MGSATHNPAFWYLRTLPGICGGFAAAYGTDELVTAFDRMSIQRPSSCGSEGVKNIKRGEESFDQRHLHTHFNQVGHRPFGQSRFSSIAHVDRLLMLTRTGCN